MLEGEPEAEVGEEHTVEAAGGGAWGGGRDAEAVGPFYGATHDRTRLRGARRNSLQHLLRGAVRPVRETGQTGRCVERR